MVSLVMSAGLRKQRLQRLGVVPIVEMAAIALQSLDRRDGGFQPFGRVGEADPAEVARRQDRQQAGDPIQNRAKMSPTPTPVESAASGIATPANPITTAPYIMR